MEDQRHLEEERTVVEDELREEKEEVEEMEPRLLEAQQERD